MKVGVLGPGALGCLLAGRLGGAGEEVILLDHDPERAGLIGRLGIRVGSDDPVLVEVTADPESAGEVGLLIVAVKAYDTREAIDQWKGILGGGGVVLTLQNGLGNLEILLEMLPAAQVAGGTTAEGATLKGPGHTVHAGSGDTVIAGARGGREAAETAAAPLVRAGFDVRIEDDPEAVIWSKFLTNVGVNALAGILRLPNGDLYKQEEIRSVIGDLIGEASAVARKKGVRLAPGDAAGKAHEVLRLTAENVNSLLQDLQRGRRTEVDFLNGKVVEEAEALGLSTPVNRAVWGMVRALEKLERIEG